MTVREFIQHLLLNGELDDRIMIEVMIPEGIEGRRFISFSPAHVTHIEDIDDISETLVECKPWTEEE